MNNNHVKKDFPIFAAHHKKPLIYLDSAATSQKPQVVIDAITNFYATGYATVHRSLYPQGEMVTTLYESIRAKTASFVGAVDPAEIVFTKGTTEGINFVASTWAKQHLQKDDEILLSQVEHHANLLPWQKVAQETGAVIKFIPLNTTTYRLDYSSDLITQKTKLVAVAHTSNVLGNIWQDGHLEQLINDAHRVGARVLIDAAQSISHTSINLALLHTDFMVFSPHKAYGPTGLGILYIKKDLHKAINPYQYGGSMVREASYETASWAEAPQKFEAGTPPIAAVVGWGATIDYLQQQNLASIHADETKLIARLLDALEKVPEVSIVGNKEALRAHGFLVSCNIASIHAHDIASYLGAQNIAVRAGHHCAQPLINKLGGESLLRFSVGMYTTSDDIDTCVTELKNGITYLKKIL